MKDVEVEVIQNLRIAKDFYKLSFMWDKKYGAPLAGNFCEIRTNELSVPFLRRPLAFAGYNEKENIAEIIYQKRGIATSVLSQKNGMKSTIEPIENEDEQGQFFVDFEDDFVCDKIKVIAPLGNSFYYTSDISEKKRIFAVAGGVGLGPILFAAKTAPFPVRLIAGFRSDEFIPDRQILGEIETTLCTEDGSEGFNGNVIEFLRTTDINSDDLIIACGPMPMLKALNDFAIENNIACKVSMEEMMACGVGACMGCVVNTVDGKYKRVCKEGPIFDSRDLLW